MSPHLICAFLIGAIAGLRSLTAPAAVSWAAALRWLHLEATPLAFLGYAATPYIFSILAVGELIADQLPRTPSRKAPPGFIARILMGGMCGAALGAPGDVMITGCLAGIVGAVAGTLGGYEARVRLARAVGKDLPIALLEDAVAVGGAFFLMSRL
jgi:uncharacterized membrane protein